MAATSFYEGDFLMGAQEGTAPIVTLLSPLTGGGSIEGGVVTFSYSVSDNEDINSCTLTITRADIGGSESFSDTSITKDITQSITLSQGNSLKLKSNQLEWFVSCIDSFSTIGTSSTITVDTQIGSAPPVSGGGGGGELTPDPDCNSLWICSDFSSCSEGIKSRDCNDLNQCVGHNPPLLISCSEPLPGDRIVGCVDFVTLDILISGWKVNVYHFQILNDAINRWKSGKC